MSQIPPMWQIMVVEDDPLIAMILEEMLAELKFGVIGPLDTVAQGLAALQNTARIDAAILDLELQGRRSLVVADALAERRIPFAFMTGYDPAMFSDIGYGNVQVLAKPFRITGLRSIMGQLLELHVA